MMECLRVLELYSGIGGMHYALKESGVAGKVVAAVDVNTTANEIYRRNFPDTPLWPKTIEGITLDEFNKLAFDVILMSPPCQPFTRIGLRGDIADPRTKSFLYILDLLPRESLLQTLKNCGYTFQEIMLSPTSLGIPNSRLRYFLIAKAAPGRFSFRTSPEILQSFPWASERNTSDLNTASHTSCPNTCRQEEEVEEDMERGSVLYKLETAQDAERKSYQNSDQSVQQIQDFLEPRMKGEAEEEMASYLLTPKTLLRYALLMDIVTPACRRSVCFTKGYGHYVEGTGSVLQSCVETEMESVFKALDQLSEEEKLQQLVRLKLRYFTPREIANLMGFPQSFTFPDQISIKQRYRVLGNSLNVRVVARLLQLLLS
ncbi:tRNA (cytosine(38)-C(5))-methyltransferase isoform X2 [Lampris incognitus]|uniref:tRNA (cytosine(38)-C(5))-methyltransferase isoform X2 n=1 Tax=Lampris incognitus TaxID=2546036 RepID=UPI0024B575E4|nr:tRNA (cytosine(38)-C(5))-methyltransferase isoform X2 [Lampris incognitus]